MRWRSSLDEARQLLKRPSDVTVFDWYAPIVMELGAYVFDNSDLYDVDDPDEAYRLLPEAIEAGAVRTALAEQGMELSAKLMEGWAPFMAKMRAMARDAVLAAVHGDWHSESYLDVLRNVCYDDLLGDLVTLFLLVTAGEAGADDV